MTRTTKKTVVGVSLSEAQQAANTYSSVSASLGKLEAQLNEKLQQVREQYEFKITDLREQLAQPVDLLEAYAKENRGEWEGKSLELSNCVIGFRTNPPSVAKKRGITWDAVVSLLKGNRLLKAFVKVKEDVDKTAILKSQTDAKVMKQLEAIGVCIEQEEQFYVDVKKDKVA
ncbi:MAG TPA: host-nuclease inhibitor Gam family protein [Niabella sp.]|nr:host-nuclease inhibitor Gam family protein [Niabella sp.]HQW14917.1 host-nuclease inhibitor Gam family protein [Niabella sp.]HQX18458.1 host-nuclease inhibitor Gam family protein [Niabella sp.]HRB05985.1 host-nuclease inhibitor Gam family protein [Niabella sp.]HRB36879.1 host-nuclease inhibitor Gam family protein [Niabella sp.]